VHERRIQYGSSHDAVCGGPRRRLRRAAAPSAAAAGGVPLQQDYINTIRRVLPSVVEIKTASGAAHLTPARFADSSNIVTDIAGQIIRTGHVTNSHRAALGVRVQTVTGPAGQPAGAGIAAVTPGGPASKAGLQPGDVITAVNGTAVTEALAAVLAGLQPGQQVSVSITKADGSTTTTTINLTLARVSGIS
jgi:membrane-associated protease RseP (regulator of RpoE activity)